MTSNGYIVEFWICAALILTAFAVRISIFRTMKDDPVARGILGDTHLVSFSDLLFCRLFFSRRKIDRRHRAKIQLFFFATLAGIVSVTALVSAIYWRSAAA
jgi:hypothetical protein